MTSVKFKGTNLDEYVAGKDRISALKSFIRRAKMEHEAEELIENSKVDFLSEFARRKLSKHQRDLLVEKHRKISVNQ